MVVGPGVRPSRCLCLLLFLFLFQQTIFQSSESVLNLFDQCLVFVQVLFAENERKLTFFFYRWQKKIQGRPLFVGLFPWYRKFAHTHTQRSRSIVWFHEPHCHSAVSAHWPFGVASFADKQLSPFAHCWYHSMGVWCHLWLVHRSMDYPMAAVHQNRTDCRMSRMQRIRPMQ